MSLDRTAGSLARLVELRSIDVDRLESELGRQQALRQRYELNLQRMEQLLASAASNDLGCPALTSNSAHYKATLIGLIDRHRHELACHDAAIASNRQALKHAALKREGLSQALDGKRRELARNRATREQKRQDQLATQAWSRRHLYSAH